jgi:hypothetical protein
MPKSSPSIPGWKKLLSYFFEFHIESAPSAYNPHLYVSLKNGRYQLCTAHAIYSFDDLYSNFYRAFELLDFKQLPSDEVLVLGLGLGSVPYMLEKSFQQDFSYDLVEIDANVIALAEKYGLSRLQSNYMAYQADAEIFMAQNTRSYAMICMDIFLDDLIPSAFESPVFLQQLQSALQPGGVLLYNRLYRQKEDKAKTRQFFEQQFLKVFPEGTYIDVDGNWVLFNMAINNEQ